MAQDWTSRATCLDALKGNYYNAYIHWYAGIDAYDGMQAKIELLPVGDVRSAIQAVAYVAAGARHAVFDIIAYALGGTNDYNIIYFLENYTLEEAPEPEPLTWKDIIIAWTEISDPAMMWTVTAIDQMRQHIWNKNPNIKWNENPFE